MREFVIDEKEETPTEALNVTRFKVGQIVDVIGVSKGKGFKAR